jgi:uncharacterized protein (DUF736 family)
VVFRPIDAKTTRRPVTASSVRATPAMSRRVLRGRSAARKAGNTLSVELDDPTLPQPVNCAMVESGDTLDAFILVWSRDGCKAKAV